jgi:hypothetical protein
MRRLVARTTVVAVLGFCVSACTGGGSTSLPFAGPPNNAGGNGGTIQTGSNGQGLIRFVQGSPDYTNVDVCIDQSAFGITSPTVAYGHVSGIYVVAGGIGHTVAVYPALTGGLGGTPGAECATAPGPYVGTVAIAVTTISTGVSARQSIVLGGTAASTTLGLYVYNDPTFPIAPSSAEAISHNAAPAFSAAQTPKSVGFGFCTTTVTPCVVATALTGATNVAAPHPSASNAVTANATVTAAAPGPPPGFYDGAGVAAGTPVPITSVAAPTPAAGQADVVQLYAIDGPAGGLNLVAVVEQTVGYGF